jgi:Trans-aconitate methyltransferase
MHEWNPDDYEKHSSARKTWGGALIAKLMLSGDEHVLDIGCGDGALTTEIAAQLPRGSVTGIDQSAEMIAHAQTRYPPPGYPNCKKEEFITELSDRYMAFHPPDTEGRIHVKMVRLEAGAVKR